MNNKAKILSFIREKHLAVVSSVNSKGLPESAVVGFVETGNLELIFSTDTFSRKAKNIRENPNVSMVIGWDYSQTVQYEGVTKELFDNNAIKYSEIYLKKTHLDANIKEHPGESLFIIKPTWVRYSDFRARPAIILEEKF